MEADGTVTGFPLEAEEGALLQGTTHKNKYFSGNKMKQNTWIKLDEKKVLKTAEHLNT
jgi:hypothetical protein